jgi:ABC-type oligopeptide transport system substrate-binding subunit
LTYEPALARDRARVIPLGRQFDLIPNAYWSDGSQVTAMDVQRTLAILKDNNWPCYRPECADLVNEISVTTDPFRVNVTLTQGYLDPLGLMAFKILPSAKLFNVENWKTQRPIGSGPFRLKEQQPPGGNVVVFEANPYYRGGTNLSVPHIREIHFIAAKERESGFKRGNFHLLLDLTTEEMKKLQEDANLRATATFATLRNRRIYFLAINHRRTALRGEEHADLRRAINHAIDREKLLDDCFRAGSKEYHQVLKGPYPSDSWACNPKVPSQYQPDRVKVQAKRANIEPTRLSLKFPDNDPQVARACEYMKTMIEGVSKNLTITLEPLSPEDLFRKVELENDYDLAYYHWDFPTEDYWLKPLFEDTPAALEQGGPNFLGYRNDGHLQALFGKAKARREFKTVQTITHEIHTHLFDVTSGQVPFIPLWQLDTHIAYRNDLKPVGLDPLLVFTHVEEWRLERQR